MPTELPPQLGLRSLGMGVISPFISDHGTGHPANADPPARKRRGALMASYRCYRVDGSDHVTGIELFELSSDSEARSRAVTIVSENHWGGYQLWELGRRVSCPIFKL